VLAINRRHPTFRHLNFNGFLYNPAAEKARSDSTLVGWIVLKYSKTYLRFQNNPFPAILFWQDFGSFYQHSQPLVWVFWFSRDGYKICWRFNRACHNYPQYLVFRIIQVKTHVGMFRAKILIVQEFFVHMGNSMVKFFKFFGWIGMDPHATHLFYTNNVIYPCNSNIYISIAYRFTYYKYIMYFLLMRLFEI
jgi:hypothetical protein